MVWPIPINWDCKVVMDINSTPDRWSQIWFDNLVNEGYNPPCLREIFGTLPLGHSNRCVFPQGNWWCWGN